MAKKITTEDLAVMVQSGFNEVQKRLDIYDKKLNMLTDDMRLVRNRLDLIETDLADIKKKLETVIDRREFEILKDESKIWNCA